VTTWESAAHAGVFASPDTSFCYGKLHRNTLIFVSILLQNPLERILLSKSAAFSRFEFHNEGVGDVPQ